MHDFIVDPDRFRAIDRNRLDLTLAYGRIGRAARGDNQVHAVFEQRRGDHENNQEHEGEIEQRRDVDFAQCRKIASVGIALHRTNSATRALCSTYLCSNSEASSAAKLSICTIIPRMLVTKQL